jgi:hypothetical protein
MSTARISEHDPRMQSALDELKRLIQVQFPEATFAVTVGEDPEGIYLSPMLDAEDTDEIMDVILAQLLDFQIDHDLPIYVLPMLPLERVAAQLKIQKKRKLPPALPYALQS